MPLHVRIAPLPLELSTPLRLSRGSSERRANAVCALAVAPLVDWIDLDGHLLIAGDPYRGIPFADGRLGLPDGPGFGVEPRDETPGGAPA